MREGDALPELLTDVATTTEHVDGTEYLWTPEGLDEDELYALRIAKRGAVGSQWGMSPPWKLDEEKVFSLYIYHLHSAMRADNLVLT